MHICREVPSALKRSRGRHFNSLTGREYIISSKEIKSFLDSKKKDLNGKFNLPKSVPLHLALLLMSFSVKSSLFIKEPSTYRRGISFRSYSALN